MNQEPTAQQTSSEQIDYKYDLTKLTYKGRSAYFQYSSGKKLVFVKKCLTCERDFFSTKRVSRWCGDKCRSKEITKNLSRNVSEWHYVKDIPNYTVHLFMPCEKCFLVSSIDLDSIIRFKWRADRDGYVTTTIRFPASDKKTFARLHRLILGAKDGEIVDHINGNPLDNRRENLRITTKQINALNNFHNMVGDNENAHIVKRKSAFYVRFAWLELGKRQTHQKSFKTIEEAKDYRMKFKTDLINRLGDFPQDESTTSEQDQPQKTN